MALLDASFSVFLRVLAFEVHHKPDKDSPRNTDKQIHRGKARKRGCKGSGKAVCKGKHLAGKDRKSTRLNSSHSGESRMPSSA